VKDSIQQLFLELYTSKGKLADPENLEFYLLKSLKHILMRKTSMEKRTSLSEAGNAGFQIELDVENRWITSEQEQSKINLLNEALQSLDPTKKELLFLKFYSGLTNQQIGALTGQRPETVQKQIYRILKTLQVTFVERFLEFFHMCCRA
jgi:RNA polymerase sigma-70 factor (ECF subfamily)